MAALDELAQLADAVDVVQVRPALAHAVRKLRQAGISLTDRRVVKLQRLIAAAAALAGRQVATVADLWPIVFAVPDAVGQDAAREALRELLAQSENDSLRMAAETASLGALARAGRLVAAAEALLADPKPTDEPWRLTLEGVAREVDAGFAPEALPPPLADVRRRIVEVLG